MNAIYDCFWCEGNNCLEPSIFKTCFNASMCYSFTVFESGGVIRYEKGCVSPDHYIICQKSKHFVQKPNSRSGYIGDCCKGSFCNNSTFSQSFVSFPVSSPMFYTSITFLILCVAFFAILIFIFAKKRYHNLLDKKCQMGSSFFPDDFSHVISLENNNDVDNYEDITSGSGSGLPFLMQRTMSKEISLQECLHKGKYNEVWRGVWREESVAIKIFYSRYEEFWIREKEIYSINMLRHENILGYLGSDFTSKNSCTQLWLITNFYPLGSLYDYLNINVLDLHQTLSILDTAISGLLHLHTELIGNDKKPGIAHRDIKSKNILMKDDHTVCIADFGLSVTNTKSTGQLSKGPESKVGTNRYMAPEVLDGTFEGDKFANHQMTDMYSFGLVMWEICKRCAKDGISDEYCAPYGDIVPSDPTIEDMRKVVCVDGQRPTIPERLKTSPVLRNIQKIFVECWAANSYSRLTALRVKKSLTRIKDSYKSENLLA